ncbi:MAG: DegT/DnrJ/EryC1/StrS aminotransferase family protein [Candidatus Levybacteria bacterium]|nr:DegT/DnrJ/EryC1/StrS aminotransferase family protein [Candidatus Levybacteria bacterium]
MKIPLYRPYISENEVSAILRVLKSRKLSKGKEVELFEKEFAHYVGKKYAIAVNSGTSGLHILTRVFGWKKGDEIITTPFSYIASANALLFEGVTPVFVDIDPNTLNIDTEKIEEKITSKTKGILLVHIFGLPVDYSKIKKIRDKYKLQIIEDACEAIGKPSDNFIITKLGKATVYGFHENKQMTSGGEGGMIVTDDPVFAQKCWSMRDQGRSLKKNWIKNVILGFNFRMTEIQAAFGKEQLKIIDKMLSRREEIAQEYSNLMHNIKGIITPHQMVTIKRSWFVYFILLKNNKIRDKVSKALLKDEIISSINYFPPIYNFPMYAKCKKGCVVANNISKRLLVLPMFYEMSNKEIQQVVNIVRDSLT